MNHKIERELKILLQEAYFAGFNRETAWNTLMERFNDIMEMGND